MDYRKTIIGRRHEQDLIREYYESPKAELVAVYGRRRVGKTYLVKQCFDETFDFYFTGSFETSRSTQLSLFKKELERYSGHKHNKPKDWYDAFDALRATAVFTAMTKCHCGRPKGSKSGSAICDGGHCRPRQTIFSRRFYLL